MIEEIDTEPKWQELVPMYFKWICKNDDRSDFAKEEITRIAKIVDQLGEMKKSGKTYTYKNGKFTEQEE